MTDAPTDTPPAPTPGQTAAYELGVLEASVGTAASAVLRVEHATTIAARQQAVESASLAVGYLAATAAVEQTRALHRIAAALEARGA